MEVRVKGSDPIPYLWLQRETISYRKRYDGVETAQNVTTNTNGCSDKHVSEITVGENVAISDTRTDNNIYTQLQVEAVANQFSHTTQRLRQMRKYGVPVMTIKTFTS